MDIGFESTLNGRTAAVPRIAGWRMAAARIWPRRRLPWIAALMLAGLGAGSYALFHSGGDAASEYATAAVAKGDIEESVTALGNLQPRDYVDVGAQATGQLKKLYVDIGDSVKQGQLLAEIDPLVAGAKVAGDQGNLASLQAQLADRQAQVALANADFSRQRQLMAADATSQADYDSAAQAAKSAIAQAKALRGQIAAAQSQLNGDQVTLGYAKIYAPMSGTVVSVSIKQGQTINSVQQAPTILRIADLSTMTVWTQVSEADVPKLKVGMPAYFTTLGDPDRRWSGKLDQIQPTPTITNNVVLYTATFDVANPGNQLMTQMTAQVFFVTASAHDVVTVPVSALHKGHGRAGGRTKSWTPKQDDGSAAQISRTPEQPRGAEFAAVRTAMHTPGAKRYWIQVVAPGGRVERRPVAIGVTSRVSAEVLAGLKPGETVVTGMKSGAAPAPRDRSGARNGRMGSRFGGFP